MRSTNTIFAALVALATGLSVHSADAAEPKKVACGTAPPLSHVGRAVSFSMAQYFLTHEGMLSRATYCNDAAGSRPLLFAPVRLFDTSKSTGDGFFDAVARQIVRTQRRFDLATLVATAPIPDRQVPDHRAPIAEFLAPALKTLHDRVLEDHPHGPFPLIRITANDASFKYAGRYETVGLEELWDLLVSRMIDEEGEPIPESEWRFYLAVRMAARVPSPHGWNNATLAVRDRQHLVLGSQTYTNDTIHPYNPTFDLGIQLKGEAAAASAEYFDALWERAQTGRMRKRRCRTSENFPVEQGDHTYRCSGKPTFEDQLLDSAWAPPPVQSEPERPLNVFVLARGPYLRHKNSWSLDTSADEAIVAAVGAAKSRIRMVQQLLVAPPRKGAFAETIFDALARAILRGVDVQIVTGEAVGRPAPFEHETPIAKLTYQRLQEHTEGIAREELGLDAEMASRRVGCRLHVAPFVAQVSYRGSGIEPRSHHRFLAIDDHAFYIGSQGLYPGAVGPQPVFSLVHNGELGVLVDDTESTAAILEQFWIPVWEMAAPGELGDTKRCVGEEPASATTDAQQGDGASEPIEQ